MSAAAKPRRWSFERFERLLILITALGLSVYLIIDATRKGELDYIYVIGLLFVVIGYFAKDLTGQDEDPKK
jgi:uncharacterized membrane protein